jgi:ElaB/YqjD/DUF883 family membrane-anchored ribosome-binding protein
LQTYSTSTSNGPTTADSSTTDQAKEKAREQAQQAAGQAKSTLRSQVEQRSTEAGRRVGGVASDVRSVGDQLRQQGNDRPAKLVDEAADRAQRLGDYLERSDADRILGDVEDFGRRRPWAVIAGGMAVGIAASRFLKASSSSRYEQHRAQSSGELPARTYHTPPATSGIRTEPVTTGSR